MLSKKPAAWLFLCAFPLSGCASLSHRVETPPAAGKPHTHYLAEVPPVAQDAYQCGPAALESVFRWWGRGADAGSIGRSLYKPGSRGVFNFMLAQYARDSGFWTQIPKVEETAAGLEALKAWIREGIPPVVMLGTGSLAPDFHFVVLKGFNDSEKIFYANVGRPETRSISYWRFEKRWREAGHWYLILCPPARVDWDLGETPAWELALFCERSGQFGLAEKWYRHALDRNPKNHALEFNLANVYLKTRRFPEAQEIYRRLLEQRPDWGPPSNNLAWTFLQEGRPREAINVLETAFKNGVQKDPAILDTLALARSRLGDAEAAGA